MRKFIIVAICLFSLEAYAGDFFSNNRDDALPNNDGEAVVFEGENFNEDATSSEGVVVDEEAVNDVDESNKGIVDSEEVVVDEEVADDEYNANKDNTSSEDDTYVILPYEGDEEVDNLVR